MRSAPWPGQGSEVEAGTGQWATSPPSGEVGGRLRSSSCPCLAKDDPLGHQQRLDEMVTSHSLEVDPKAETKTRAVLEHFAAAARG